MTRSSSALTLAVGALLLFSAPATAKELTSVAACGPESCNNLSGPGLRDFPNLGEPIGTIPQPGAFYEVRFTIDADGPRHSWTYWYVPSAKMLALPDERQGVIWVPFAPIQLLRLTEDLEPFPAPEITLVTVGTRKVDDPSSYLRLFTVRSTGDVIPQGLPDWEPVTFRSKLPSPWTTGPATIYYSPSSGLLQRGVDMIKLPTGMADDLRSGGSLEESGFPWLRVLLPFAAALLLVVAAIAAVPQLRRRAAIRQQPRTA